MKAEDFGDTARGVPEIFLVHSKKKWLKQRERNKVKYGVVEF